MVVELPIFEISVHDHVGIVLDKRNPKKVDLNIKLLEIFRHWFAL